MLPWLERERFVWTGSAPWLEHLATWGALAIVGVTVLLSQPYFVGFAPGHHGWVSSHYLAILEHSTADNAFVGYTIEEQVGTGQTRHVYWNRYPAIGSTLQRWLTLQYSDRLVDKIHASRQFMNVVHILIMGLAYLVLNRLLRQRTIAMAVVLVTFSSRYFLYYKDMIFAEQISILASLMVVLAIQRFYDSGRIVPLLVFTALGLSIGRGFAVLPILLIWLVFEVVRWAMSRRGAARAGTRRLARTSALVLLCGVMLTGAHTLYNIAVEATIREVSLAETSVVEAAMRRGGFNAEFNEEAGEERSWARFIPQQARRLRVDLFPIPDQLRGYVPWKLWSSECRDPVCYLAVLAVLAVGITCLWTDYRHRWRPGQRFAAMALLTYGAIWLGLARNLAVFHDYTALYYYGVPLVLYGAIASKLPRKSAPLLLVAGLTVFLMNNADANADKARMARQTNWITRDFQRIADLLPPRRVIYYDGGYREFLSRRPYASGFFLPDNPVTDDPALADYVVTRRSVVGWLHLTSNNRRIFLFQKARE